MPQTQSDHTSPLVFAHWIEDASRPEAGVCFARDVQGAPAVPLRDQTIVASAGDEARAHQLLAEGVARVLLGDAALLDGTLIRRLVEQYGGEHIGVAVYARKHQVSWTIDKVSNADFRCLTPSFGKPGWELLLSDGSATGTDAEWWLGEMLGYGASAALIHIDMQDDDLNICAGLVESHGSKLWFTPWQLTDIDLEPWVRYGQVRQLLLPVQNTRDADEMARILEAAGPEREMAVAETSEVLSDEKAMA
jgi:hypothetical protein